MPRRCYFLTFQTTYHHSTQTEKKEKTSQPYKPSKHDSTQSQNVNWKSPTFWPMIDQAVKEQIRKPNLSEIIWTLQSQDNWFQLLTYQRLSDWQNKTQMGKIFCSKETLHDVQKGFFPGGNQTCYSVFVSFLHITYSAITNTRKGRIILTYSLRSKSH